MKQGLAFLKKNIKHGSTVVVAVSGGPDSMVLFDLLIKSRLDLKIIVAHINHGVRKESASEAEFVKKTAMAANCIFEDLELGKNKENENFHSYARNQRYSFFEKIANKHNAKIVLTAHHGDDLTETILMRLIRGTGLDALAGLAPISYRNNLIIMRPLLKLGKKDIIKYLENNQIEFVIDKSNDSEKYTRNRIRSKLIPLIAEENPKYLKNFYELNKEIVEFKNYLDDEILLKKNKIIIENKVDLKLLVEEKSFIRRKIIFLWLKDNYGNNINVINKKHINSIMATLNNAVGHLELNLPFNKKLVKENKYFRLSESLKDDDVDYLLELNSKTEIPNGKIISIVKSSEQTSNNVTFLSLKGLNLPLYIKKIDLKGRMSLKNSMINKKINRILIDDKISSEERNKLPMVIDNSGIIVWIPGIKKSKYDVGKNGEYDIILKYH